MDKKLNFENFSRTCGWKDSKRCSGCFDNYDTLCQEPCDLFDFWKNKIESES